MYSITEHTLLLLSVSVLLFPAVVSLDEDKEMIGNLKVSLEAAKALSGIYQEFHQKIETEKKDDTDDEEKQEEEKKKYDILIEYDDDSDF